MMKYDIVYILKNNIDSEEIRYSVRSVVENFPYRKIWFYCGCPDYMIPDEHVQFEQIGSSKWDRSTYALAQVCKNDDITEDFWLFNDDFFVMQKVTNLSPCYRGTLQKRCRDINGRGMPSGYSRQLNRTAHILRINGYKQLDYALHIPMLINRKKAQEVLNKFQGYPMFRSLYGNYWDVGGEKIKDVKIANKDADVPENSRFLSTDDASFLYGKVGDYIRSRFTEPTKYESDA